MDYKLSPDQQAEVNDLIERAQNDLEAVLFRLVGQREQLREAVSRLPDVTLDDVPRDGVPTHELISRIRDCRALLPANETDEQRAGERAPTSNKKD